MKERPWFWPSIIGGPACITAIVLAACSPVRVQPICPTLVSYSQTEQTALASELRAHPDLHEAPRWLSDYVGLRDQVRACGEK